MISGSNFPIKHSFNPVLFFPLPESESLFARVVGSFRQGQLTFYVLKVLEIKVHFWRLTRQ